MPVKQILIDSSFACALYSAKDKYWERAVRFALADRTSIRVFPDVALTEIAQVLTKNHVTGGVQILLRALQTPLTRIEAVTKDDLNRVDELLITYADSRLDFVDLCIVALAERLNIAEICTFDRRDFAIVRPKHVESLTLLP